jgi:hypothetical protein
MLLIGAALVFALSMVGCGPAERPEPEVAASLPVQADRPAGDGPVVRRCGSHYAAEFDAGMEGRILAAGPVSIAGFRIAPDPDASAPVRTFKMMVRLTPGAEATLTVRTDGTSLLYDRARFVASNVYRLSDGDQIVRFEGCPEAPAIFNGAVLTTGPTTIDLDITTSGETETVRVTAYGSQ